MGISELKDKISKFPQNSGVYVFKDKKGEVLYVGKAANLRSRVGSYFRFQTDSNRRMNANLRIANRPIEAMLDQVADVKVQETDSVLEALILEANLIKKLQPKYNAMGKDDKSFVYAVITKEEWPRVLILRGTELDILKRSDRSKPKRPKAVGPLLKVFGPYTSKKQLEIALKIIRKIFPYHSSSQKTEKGCLDFQLGRCPGPHAGAITSEDYRKNIRGIKMILEGRKKSLVRRLETEMRELARKYEFEKAAELRSKIFALRHIQDVALITSDEQSQINLKSQISNLKSLRIEAYDVSNISGQYAVGSMVVFENKEPDKSQYRKFKIKTVAGIDDVGAMREVLLRRFRNDWPQPDLIFLDGGKGHLNMGERLLKELGMKIPIVAVAKGVGRKKLNIFFSYANQQINANPQIANILSDKKLIKRIIDEAHRFAIGYHRKLRKKSLVL